MWKLSFKHKFRGIWNTESYIRLWNHLYRKKNLYFCPSHFKLGWKKICSRDQCCFGKEVLLVFLTPNIYDVLQYLYSYVGHKTLS